MRYTPQSVLGRLALLVVAAGACACGSSPGTPRDPAVSGPEVLSLPGPETVQLVAALQRQGATAELAEIMPESSMPFFSTRAARVLVNAASVHVFEYATVSEADAEAARVSADGGTVGATQVFWVSAPHFFRGNRLIVLYVGTDDRIIQMLASLLGPQFAGR